LTTVETLPTTILEYNLSIYLSSTANPAQFDKSWLDWLC
jgi:hypothetical protein